MPGCGVEQGASVEFRGQPQEQVQAGGLAAGLDLGQVGGEGGEQPVAAGSVDRAYASQVSREGAAVEEAGERQLAECLAGDIR